MDLPEVVPQTQLQAGGKGCEGARGVWSQAWLPSDLGEPWLWGCQQGQEELPGLRWTGKGGAPPASPCGRPGDLGPSLHSVGLELLTQLLMHF